MRPLPPYLDLLGCPAVVLAAFTRLARLIRRRGGSGVTGAALAAYEEAFRTTSHTAHAEIRAQADRKAPTGSPDGRRPGLRIRRKNGGAV